MEKHRAEIEISQRCAEISHVDVARRTVDLVEAVHAGVDAVERRIVACRKCRHLVRPLDLAVMQRIADGIADRKPQATELAVVDIALGKIRAKDADGRIKDAAPAGQIIAVKTELTVVRAAVQVLLILDHARRMPVAVDVVIGEDPKAQPRTAVAALNAARARSIGTHLGVNLESRLRLLGQEHRRIELLLGILLVRIAHEREILDKGCTKSHRRVHDVWLDERLAVRIRTAHAGREGVRCSRDGNGHGRGGRTCRSACLHRAFSQRHAREDFLPALRNLRQSKLALLAPHRGERVVARRKLHAKTRLRRLFLQRLHDLQAIRAAQRLAHEALLRLFRRRLGIGERPLRHALLLSVELDMHLVAHGETRKTPIFVRERSLLYAVNLVQPLRHNADKLLARTLLRHLARKIDVPLRIELPDRFIDPVGHSLRGRSRCRQNAEDRGTENACAAGMSPKQRLFFHFHHIRLFSPYFFFLIIITHKLYI